MWGQLAAIAGITWETAEGWLQRGRPMNLVAVSALQCCFDNDAGIGAWLARHEPKLLQPVPPAIMISALEQVDEEPVRLVHEASESTIRLMKDLK